MKIAIQGHPNRGKEVIRILEQLGGKNTVKLEGTHKTFYYIDYKNEISGDHKDNLPPNYKPYTLEEFEEKFPFKLGDKVLWPVKTGWWSGIIVDLNPNYYKIIDDKCNYYFVESSKLSLYPMQKERNITLTLDKAKEWYNKGGELKEIALQAFSEKELTKVDLPKTWEEFCDNYPVKGSEAMIDCNAEIIDCINIQGKREYMFKDIMPSKKSAEAHLALIQLEQFPQPFHHR